MGTDIYDQISMGRCGEARQGLEASTRDLDPLEAELLWAKLLLAQEDFANAADHARAAVRIDAECSYARDLLDGALLLLGAAPYRVGLASRRSSYAYYVSARSSFFRKNWRQALKWANATLRLDSQFLPARAIQAACQAILNSDRESELRLRSFLDYDRDPVSGRFLAFYYEHTGRSSEAKEVLKECISLAPNVVAHRRALSNFFFRGRSAVEDREVLDEALRIWPGHPRLNFALARHMIANGRSSEALGLLESRFSEAPADFENTRLLAIQRLRACKPFKAIRTVVAGFKAAIHLGEI